MDKYTFRKFLCTPFILVSIPILCIGLLFRYGLEDTIDIFDDIKKSFRSKNGT